MIIYRFQFVKDKYDLLLFDLSEDPVYAPLRREDVDLGSK